MKATKIKHERKSPVKVIPISFLLAILVGTGLLMLPFSTVPGEETDIITALFTATTSICVTGLVVVDTCSHWTLFGHIVILLLIQIGGLGVVAVGAMFMMVRKKKLTLEDRVLLGSSLNIDKSGGLLAFLIKIFKGTFLVEGVGAVLYSAKFVPLLGLKGLWASVFNSVSAFCNAGMDIIGPDSMISFQDSPYLLGVTMALIVLGGLGFVVWFDMIGGIRTGLKRRLPLCTVIDHLSEHSKLVLTMTGLLILTGTIGIFAAEYYNFATIGNMSLSGKLANSLFQSVTLRTAGFASVPQESLTELSCLICYILMFIGGSPVGTAGGIKTVTAFLVFRNALSYVRGNKESVVFRRRVPEEMIRKAAAIVFVSCCVACVMTLLLVAIEDIPLVNALFEILSALGTVGLSRGVTPGLGTVGRLIVIIAMYLGRIGPISMAVFFAKTAGKENKVQHADGVFYVG